MRPLLPPRTDDAPKPGFRGAELSDPWADRENDAVSLLESCVRTSQRIQDDSVYARDCQRVLSGIGWDGYPPTNEVVGPPLIAHSHLEMTPIQTNLESEPPIGSAD